MCSFVGLQIVDHWFTVPLDYRGGLHGTIQVFVREVVAMNKLKQAASLPFLLYLQGATPSALA